MVNHRHYIMSQEPKNQQLLNTLHKVRDKSRAKDLCFFFCQNLLDLMYVILFFQITKSRGAALQQLLQLSGRSQLVTAQVTYQSSS